MSITQSRLMEVLKYNPDTGGFAYRVSTGRCKAGSAAGTDNGNGYVRIIIDGQKYYAHRLAWLYMTGRMPDAQIDHVNMIRNDNRFLNLREASNGQNSANRPSRTSCGLKGVQKHGRAWRAQLWKDGGNFHIGPFSTKEEAHAAYVAAHREVHGEYSRQ